MRHQCISCNRLFQSSMSLDRHRCRGPPSLQNTCKLATPATANSTQPDSRPSKRACFVSPQVCEDAIAQSHDMNLAGVSDIPPHSSHQSHARCDLAASSAYHAISWTTCPMVTCPWLTYHPVHPPLLRVMTAFPLRRLKILLLPMCHVTPSRLQSTRSGCLEDTHTHRHGT